MPLSILSQGFSHIMSNSGRSCLLMSHIPTQSSGAWNEMTGMPLHHQHLYTPAKSQPSVAVTKVNRMLEIAL